MKDEFKDGAFSLQAGALALGDKGIVAIDEAGNIPRHIWEYLKIAMEQQSVPIDRAGIHAVINTRCAILMTANPKLGRFDPTESIYDQINLPTTIMGRIDLMFISYDNPEAKMDRAISDRILDADMGIAEATKPAVDPILLKKWVAYGKRNCHPKLTKASRDRIQQYYLDEREASQNSSMKITARNLNGLTRFCKAAARATLSSTVENRHIDIVLKLFEKSMHDVCLDENGKVDVDLVNIGIGKAQREKMTDILNIIRAATGNTKDIAVKVEAIFEECINRGIKAQTVEDELKKLKEVGKIYMPAEGKVCLT